MVTALLIGMLLLIAIGVDVVRQEKKSERNKVSCANVTIKKIKFGECDVFKIDNESLKWGKLNFVEEEWVFTPTEELRGERAEEVNWWALYLANDTWPNG